MFKHRRIFKFIVVTHFEASHKQKKIRKEKIQKKIEKKLEENKKYILIKRIYTRMLKKLLKTDG